MTRAQAIIGAAVLAGGLVLLPAQPPTGEKIDISKLGPQVGEPAPDFTLKDQEGRTRDMNSIMGPKGAMLVFIRSADW